MSELIGDLLYPENATLRDDANRLQKDLVKTYDDLKVLVDRYNVVVKDVYAISLNNMTLVGIHAMGKKPMEAVRAYMDTAIDSPEPPPWESPVQYALAIFGINSTLLPAGWAAYRYFAVQSQVRAQMKEVGEEFTGLMRRLELSRGELADALAVRLEAQAVEANAGNSVALRVFNDAMEDFEAVASGEEVAGLEAQILARKAAYQAIADELAVDVSATRWALGISVVGLVLTIAIEFIVSAISAKQMNDQLHAVLDEIKTKQDQINTAIASMNSRLTRLDMLRAKVIDRLTAIRKSISALRPSFTLPALPDSADTTAILASQNALLFMFQVDISNVMLVREAMEKPDYKKDPKAGDALLMKLFAQDQLERIKDLIKKLDSSTDSYFADPFAVG